MAYIGEMSETMMNEVKKVGIEPAPYTINKIGRSPANPKLKQKNEGTSSGVTGWNAQLQAVTGNTLEEHPGQLLNDVKSTKRRIENIAAAIQQATKDLEELDQLIAEDLTPGSPETNA